ncbi:MAG: GspE/PulE family protein [Granulosicoccaceae bacterium]
MSASRESGAACVVFADPSDLVALDAVKQRLGSRSLEILVAEDAEIERALKRTFSANSSQREAGETGAVELLTEMITAAQLQSVSDIHIEPTRDCARVRFRLDGVLRSWCHITTAQWKTLVGRVKVLAELDIADSRSAQDGRFAHGADGREIDIRVSAMPTDCGEAVVMRLLDRHRCALDLTELGVQESQQQLLRQLLRKPEGMLVVCGPTGSGKSTSLYALVESIRGESLNIITLEDPVEYPTTWVRQSSINDAISMDFAQGVRAALRQDPDVMLIGELRDGETAKMALRAAMTGHRVLTTVHANSAIASVARLWDLGLEPHLLAGNLIGVVAQRLLRCLCQSCKKADPDRLGCFVACGCDSCEAGYSGRVPVFEIWPVDDEFDELLHGAASRRSFESLARERGHGSLHDAALVLLEQGKTSAAEVERVIGPVEGGRYA